MWGVQCVALVRGMLMRGVQCVALVRGGAWESHLRAHVVGTCSRPPPDSQVRRWAGRGAMLESRAGFGGVLPPLLLPAKLYMTGGYQVLE